MHVRTRFALGCGAVAVGVIGAAAALAGHGGFTTSQPSMALPASPGLPGLAGEPVLAGVEVTPLLTVGDTLASGYRFESIPDGIAIDRRGKDVDVWVNHETGKSPFPFSNPGGTAANGENDFENSQLSHLVLDEKTAAVKSGEIVIPSSAGFQRFCSSFLATEKEGFDRDILFMNEESPDWFLRQENSWPPALDDPAQKQAGLVIAYDVKKGTYEPIYGMGRHNHENSVALPGFKGNVVLSGDDTFTSGPLTGVAFPAGVTAPAQSQLYSYIAKDTEKLLKDEGDLWAFVSDDPAFDDYYDFVPGDTTTSVSGHFIKVPKAIATGLNPDGSELMHDDISELDIEGLDDDFPAPPDNGTWQRDSRISTALAPAVVAGSGVDGPQWVLEYWSDINNVFQFVRVEDIAYDKQKGKGHNTVAYVVDSGRGSAGQGTGISTNGRVWKMVFDKKDPTVVTSLSIFVEGDDKVVKSVDEVHQPDNIESTKHGLLLTEDPGSSQQFDASQQVSDAARATTARLWWIPFAGSPAVVARVDQSADGGATDVSTTIGRWGAWETSGIVDASKAFGKDMFLLNVQAHSLWIAKGPGGRQLHATGRRSGLHEQARRRTDGAPQDSRSLLSVRPYGGALRGAPTNGHGSCITLVGLAGPLLHSAVVRSPDCLLSD